MDNRLLSTIPHTVGELRNIYGPKVLSLTVEQLSRMTVNDLLKFCYYPIDAANDRGRKIEQLHSNLRTCVREGNDTLLSETVNNTQSDAATNEGSLSVAAPGVVNTAYPPTKNFQSSAVANVPTESQQLTDNLSPDMINHQTLPTTASKYINNSLQNRYKCLLCDRRVFTLTGLTNHITSHIIGQKGSVCSVCNNAFPNQIRLHVHYDVTHGWRTCEECGICFSGNVQSVSMAHHLQYDCEVVSKSKDYRDKHVIDSDTEVCADNDIESDTDIQSTYNHSSPVTNSQMLPTTCSEYNDESMQSRRYKCLVCDRRVYTSTALTSHLASHVIGQKCAACKICGETFSNQIRLRVHYQVKHNIRFGASRVCKSLMPDQLETRNKIIFQGSIVTVDGNVQFKCHKCGQLFTKFQWGLRKHIRDRTVRCENQNKVYSECCECKVSYTGSDMKTHGCKNFGEFPCQLCDKRFLTEEECFTHINMHSNEVGNTLHCKLCGLKLPTLTALEKHLLSHNSPTGQRTKCVTCKEMFPGESIRKHGCKIFGECPCKRCGDRFRVPSAFIKHMLDVHGEDVKKESCKVCGKMFHTKNNLADHIKSTHNNKRQMIPCQNVQSVSMAHHLQYGSEVVSKSKDYRDKHVIDSDTKGCADNDMESDTDIQSTYHHSSPVTNGQIMPDQLETLKIIFQGSIVTVNGNVQFKCHKCGHLFTTFRTGLRRHIKRSVRCENQNKVYSECCECKVSCTGSDLKTHGCKNFGEFPCQLCDKRFLTEEAYFTHIKMHSNDIGNTLQCKLCGLKLPGLTALEKHLLSHNPPTEQRTKCVTCKEMFPRKSIRKHGCKIFGKYPCKRCEDRFLVPSAFGKHMLDVHGEDKRESCEVCGKVFYTKKYLADHIKATHNKKRQKIPCYRCGKMLKKDYVAVHDSYCKMNPVEKSIPCDMCHRKFASNQARDQHIHETHKPARDAMCTICGRLFKLRHLHQHQASHSEERPFKCTFNMCDQTFKLKTHLTQHEKTHIGKSRSIALQDE